MTYNPNSPETIGLEWFPNRETTAGLTSALAAQGFKIVSTTAETIDQLIVPHAWTGPATGYGRQWTDIYASTSVVGANPTVLTYYPNEDKASGGGLRWENQVSTGSYWARLDDVANDSTAEAEYMMNIGTGATPATWRGQFNTAAIPTTKRVVSVTLQIRAKGFDWAWQQPRIEVEWWNGSTKLGVIGTIYPPQTVPYTWANYTLGPFYYDWFNEGPWLQPEIAALDNNTLRNLGLSLYYSAAVSRIALEVAVVDETRVAVGIGPRQASLPTGLQTNLPLSLKTPLNVDNWAKAASSTYFAVVRRLEEPFGTASTMSPVSSTLSGAPCPHGQGADLAAVVANQSGDPSSITAGSADVTHAYWMGTSGGAQSVDSQPYHDLATSDVSSATAGTGPSQNFVAPSSSPTYRRIRATVAVDPAAMPTHALTFGIFRTSDNVQMGGSAVLAVADLADASKATSLGTFGTLNAYDVVATMTASASLVATVGYYVALTSSTPPTNAWKAVYLDAPASHALTGNITFGAATAQLFQASASVATADLCLSVGSVPTAPAALSVTLDTLTLPNGHFMDYATATWVATSLGASFARYEVERSLDNGATWTQIATISTEASITFDDHEGARQTAAKYRVRVVRIDNAASDWVTQAGAVTPTMSGGLLVFTSNEDPSITVGYVVDGVDTSYGFASGDRHVRVELHDRDYAVVFKPTEERGVVWPFVLQVHMGGATIPGGGAGIRAFDPIRAISEAAVSAVCVHTFDGERLFGSLAVRRGVRYEPMRGYLADCEFTETMAESSAVML